MFSSATIGSSEIESQIDRRNSIQHLRRSSKLSVGENQHRWSYNSTKRVTNRQPYNRSPNHTLSHSRETLESESNNFILSPKDKNNNSNISEISFKR